ncbi:peptidase family M28 [Pseudomassariella vexata]|uniref:Peptide hydrolase n=1 Tax=Pseudomassariella vexata TaxID=1141098 RepID=A0A1Y2D644_9PEZI|nr:peptidase family M28 [Pseudomassariella vexata]ORY54566.1 peptidase family M28 [Pseudomassariella vexata]
MGSFIFPRHVGRLASFFILSLLSQLPFAYEQVSDQTLRNIPSGQGDFDILSGPLLSPILIPRVPGTPGSEAVQKHFVNFFSEYLPDWSVDWHNSTSKTPATGVKDVPFSNLIFTRDPPWAQAGDVGRLTLVAHYDSLWKPEGFIGAVDSAAPCAILMHVARSIDAALTKKWDDMKASGEAGLGLEAEKGVQILLLDGEEAFVDWSATDSIYGARALAEHWESKMYPASTAYRTPIDAIGLFLLLDLLGAADPHVPSYFQKTHWAYQRMAKIEERMRKLDILQSTPKNAFIPNVGERDYVPCGYIEDDHIPFLVRGVDILHIIPMPFPDVWHTMDDNAEHLDIGTVDDWAKIITGFAAEWMELDGFMDSPKQPLEKGPDVRERSEL